MLSSIHGVLRFGQVPSAPPLHCDLETVLEGEGDLLSLEPPTWVPDSHAGDCSACHEAFRCGVFVYSHSGTYTNWLYKGGGCCYAQPHLTCVGCVDDDEWGY